MEKNKKEILLLPCYEHDIREYAKLHMPPLTPVYQLTPEEEKEFQEENRKAELLDKIEDGEEINKEKLSQDEKFLLWKMKFQKGGKNE